MFTIPWPQGRLFGVFSSGTFFPHLFTACAFFPRLVQASCLGEEEIHRLQRTRRLRHGSSGSTARRARGVSTRAPCGLRVVRGRHP